MLKVLYCGARWLGMECLKELLKYPDVEIVAAVVPRKKQNVWWADVVDEDVAADLGIEVISWKTATQLRGLDLVFSVLHGPIFKEPFISSIRSGILNLHPAPPPFYRGCNSYAHALINGEQWYGVTLHYVDEEIDTGPIIDLYWTEMHQEDTGRSLYDRSQRLARKVFQDRLPDILEAATAGRKVPARPQNDKLSRYYARDSLDNKEVDLTWNKRQIYNFVRGLQFTPFEPAYFVQDGKKIHLTVVNGLVTLNFDWAP